MSSIAGQGNPYGGTLLGSMLMMLEKMGMYPHVCAGMYVYVCVSRKSVFVLCKATH